MKGWQEWFNDNPVLWYHLFGQARLRLRSHTIALTLFGAVGLLLYLYLLAQIARYGMEPSFLIYLQLFLVCLMLPAASHALMSSEHEKSTWDALILTRLTAGQIVVGKLLTRWLMLALLLLIFLFPALINWAKEAPGLSPTILFRSEWVTFTYGFLLIAFTTWVSNRARSSMAAAAISFGAQFLCLIALPMLFIALFEPFLDINPRQSLWFLNPIGMMFYMNPYYIQHYLIDERIYNKYSPNDPAGFAGFEYWGWGQAFVYLLLGLLFVYWTVRSVRVKWHKRF